MDKKVIEQNYENILINDVNYLIPVIKKQVILNDTYFNVNYKKLYEKYGSFRKQQQQQSQNDNWKGD